MDILEERRCRSDLGHALRTFNPHLYQGVSPCSTAELNKAVQESQYLRYVTKEVELCHFKQHNTEVSPCSLINMKLVFSLHTSSDRHGDRVISGGGQRGRLWDFGGNVTKLADGFY